jgi:hypothetical protein
MTNKALAVIRRIGDWYLMEHGTYIRIYRATKAPHLLPRFVPDKLVLQEVAYQTMINGVRAMLYQDKKAILAPTPIMDRLLLIHKPPSKPKMKWIHYYHITSEEEIQKA